MSSTFASVCDEQSTMFSRTIMSVRPRRVWATCLGVFVLLYLTFSFRGLRGFNVDEQAHASSSVGSHDFVSFGMSLFEALVIAAPGIPKLEPSRNVDSFAFWRATEETPRPDLLPMDENQLEAIRSAHDTYLQMVHQLPRLHVPFRAGEQGIVSTAGGAQIPIFLVTLGMLRRTGCSLPVELFVSSEDYDQYMCDKLLPSQNAKCVQLEDFVGGEETSTIAKYQFKILAILFSSFENLLFLDADNYPVINPERFFTHEPFISSGLVTWPDFWASSISRHFFDIQDKAVPPMNALATTESGQLLVNKRTHGKALLMAAYYNYLGPGYYYPLLSQGGTGEGDKETFVAGAQAVSAPFYQVKKCVDTAGYYEGTQYHGVAMLQYDPVDDHKGATKPRIFTVHHNYPKLDPVRIFRGNEFSFITAQKNRLMGPKEVNEERFGRDVEEEMWQEMEYVACELGDKLSKWHAITSTTGRKGTCARIREYQKAVFKET